MPLNISIQQILLHMFNFVLLFGILYFLLYKPVKDFMDKRQNEYEEMDKKAKDSLKAADELKAEYESKLSDAKAEADTLRREAVKAADDDRDKIIEAANTKAAEIVDKAHAKAEADAQMIKSKTQNELASYVSSMAQKIVMDESDPEGFDSFFKTVESNETSEE